MMEVSVEILVPNGTDPLEHRDRVVALTREMGFPEPHSADIGYSLTGGSSTAGLQWTLDSRLKPLMAIGFKVIRGYFNVINADCFDVEECPPLSGAQQEFLDVFLTGDYTQARPEGDDVVLTDRDGNEVSLKRGVLDGEG